VSSKTSFVLVGERAGSKANKAQDLQVPCYTLAEFEQQYPSIDLSLLASDKVSDVPNLSQQSLFG